MALGRPVGGIDRTKSYAHMREAIGNGLFPAPCGLRGTPWGRNGAGWAAIGACYGDERETCFIAYLGHTRLNPLADN